MEHGHPPHELGGNRKNGLRPHDVHLREQLICDSVAGFGESSGYITPEGFRHISSMSTCSGEPLATIRRGQTLRLHTIYDVPTEHEEVDNAMGIMILYVNPA